MISNVGMLHPSGAIKEKTKKPAESVPGTLAIQSYYSLLSGWGCNGYEHDSYLLNPKSDLSFSLSLL